MRRWGLAFAVSVALVAAVPAAASHHPPNSVPGAVMVSVTNPPGSKSLVFKYTVTPTPCGSSFCYPNYGRPYSIALYVDGPGAVDGFKGVPTLVSPPPSCQAATRPVVHCDTDRRDTEDPTTVLPISGSFTVSGTWVKNATAEIVVEGFALNSYQEGVAVPPPDCGSEQRDYDRANARFEARAGDFMDDLVRLHDTETSLKYAIFHDLVKAQLKQTMRDTNHLLSQLIDFAQALRLCEGRDLPKASATPLEARACTTAKWTALFARADTLKLMKMVPVVKKILAAQKANQPAKATRLRKQLKRQLAVERKRITAYRKAMAGCLS
jgi:hypothetical protein